MNKAVFFDIDGTLIDCMQNQYEPSNEVKQALEQLKDEGDYIFIATGRPYAFLTEEIKRLPFDGLILSNGSQVIFGEKVIYENPMQENQLKQLIDKIEAWHIEYILEGYPYSYIKKESQDLYKFYDSIQIPMSYVKREEAPRNYPVFKIETLCPDKKVTMMIQTLLKENPYFDYFCSIDQSAVEIFAKNNTKATGIQRILEYLNISKNQSFAFGDGINDIDMLRFVGTGIAMGNASENVKIHADFITDSVENHGVASGILKHVIYR